MTAVATIVAQTETKPAKIILVGTDGAGLVAASVLKARLGASWLTSKVSASRH